MNLQNPIYNLLPANFAYEVPKNRVLFQASTYSMGVNEPLGFRYILKNNGNTVLAIETENGKVPAGQFTNNNHPASGNLVFETGTAEITLENISTKNIVLGIGEIQQAQNENLAYRFYDPAGLKTTPYFTQINPGEIKKLSSPIIAANNFGAVQDLGYLHKQFNCNVIYQSAIYLGELEVNYGDNNYYNFDQVYIPINSVRNFTIHLKADRSKSISLQVQTYGNGETGTVKILDKNGLDLATNHIRLTSYVFNYQNYNITEGNRDVFYKMFSNEGTVNLQKMSIEQAAAKPKQSTASIFKNKNWYYLLLLIPAYFIFNHLKKRK